MAFFFLLLALVALFIGGGTFVQAKTALHEIEGLIAILIAVIFMVGAAVVSEIDRARKELKPPQPKNPDK